jgi:hypothetical protein
VAIVKQSHSKVIMQSVRTALALLAFAAACGTATEPIAAPEASGEFNITSTRQGDDAANILPLGADANAGPSSIIIMGHIRTPTPCYDLSPRVERDGSRITATITARHTSAQVCAQVLVVRSFTLKVPSLAAGSYSVKVVYETIDSRTSTETKLEKTVVVQ